MKTRSKLSDTEKLDMTTRIKAVIREVMGLGSSYELSLETILVDALHMRRTDRIEVSMALE